MHTTDLIHRSPVNWPARPAFERPTLAPSYHQLIAPVRGAILRARQAVENEQRPDGSWLGRQCGDSSLASQLVLLLALLEREDSELAEQAAAAIRADQLADGAWSRTLDGPADASASVTAYFALKIIGDAPTEPHMSRARQAIRALGGADAADARTRLWLALLGQIDYEYCEPIAPEWLLLPESWQRRALGAGLNAAERRRLTALAVVWSLRPARPLELSRGVRELFVESPHDWPDNQSPATDWMRAWSTMSRLCERAGLVPFRERALALAEKQLARDAAQAESRELGFDELIWQIVALHALGHSADGRERTACETRLRQLVVVDDSHAARPQSTTTSVADTIQSLAALTASGIAATQPTVANGGAWLADRVAAQKSLEGVESTAGLASLLGMLADLMDQPETDDALPPDIQMTRDRVARFLARQRNRELPVENLQCLAEQARDILLAQMRSRAAPDEIGAALEALTKHGLPTNHRTVIFGAALLRITQRADGSWTGANGESSVDATTWAIRGLVAAGAEADSPAVAAGVNWLCVHEGVTGGWGDVPQTASVVLALTVAGATDHDATRRGIEWLVDRHEQNAASEGDDFDLCATTISLSALARWAVTANAAHAEPVPTRLRLIGELSLV